LAGPVDPPLGDSASALASRGAADSVPEDP
jgi:hypothetical protein